MSRSPKASTKRVYRLFETIHEAERDSRRASLLDKDLRTSLEKLVTLTGTRRANMEVASRHVLCAEALAEVLELRLRDGRCNRGDQEGQIADEYSRVAAAKVLAFHSRKPHDQKRIVETYPHLHLDDVALAQKHGLLRPEFVAGVLEESSEYRALLRKLVKAGLRRPD